MFLLKTIYPVNKSNSGWCCDLQHILKQLYKLKTQGKDNVIKQSLKESFS